MKIEQYFAWPNVPTFNLTVWFRLKMMLFGTKIVWRGDGVRIVWYVYKGKMHLVKYESA